MIKLFYKKDKIQLIFDQKLRTLKEKEKCREKILLQNNGRYLFVTYYKVADNLLFISVMVLWMVTIFSVSKYA